MNKATIERRGMWQVAVICKQAMCSDGKRRNVQLTREPDTLYTIPGRVRVRGVTVTGFITSAAGDDGVKDWKFIANTYGKNGHLLS